MIGKLIFESVFMTLCARRTLVKTIAIENLERVNANASFALMYTNDRSLICISQLRTCTKNNFISNIT